MEKPIEKVLSKEESLKEFLRNYFNIRDRLNKFNNSEIISMSFRYTTKKICILLPKLPVFFPFKATDIEIVNKLKNIISVPFIIAVGREPDNNDLIYSIVISRVFIPNQ